jgi:hypothetical protein
LSPPCFALPGAGVAHASDNGNTTGNFNIPVGSDHHYHHGEHRDLA